LILRVDEEFSVNEVIAVPPGTHPDYETSDQSALLIASAHEQIGLAVPPVSQQRSGLLDVPVFIGIVRQSAQVHRAQFIKVIFSGRNDLHTPIMRAWQRSVSRDYYGKS
jgi:hypothetical protein